MVIQTKDKEYQKLLKRGSILKGLRSIKGGGLGCIAGGITCLVFALLLLFMFFIIDLLRIGVFFLALCGIPGALLVLIGILLRLKRNSSYMAFYQKETGFSEEELRQVDRELASPNVQIIGYKRDGSFNQRAIACFITEHYFVTEHYYIRKLEDLVAVAFTNKPVIWGLLCLSKQDSKVQFMSFLTPTEKKSALCTEIIQALFLRNPQILRGQYLKCDNRTYDLLDENTSKEILRLYLEGRKFEETV